MKKTLIGIHGKPRAGKDTIANHLIYKHNFIRFGPSVPVKLATAAMFGFPVEYLNIDTMKDQRDEFWNMTYREMAQKVGKECSRDIFGQDFWMRHVERALLMIPSAGIVLADIRYANEAIWVKQHGGLVVFVTRDERGFVSGEQHVAEQGLSFDLADVILSNNGTIADLLQQVDLIVEPYLNA